MMFKILSEAVISHMSNKLTLRQMKWLNTKYGIAFIFYAGKLHGVELEGGSE